MRATETEISAALWAHMAQEGLFLHFIMNYSLQGAGVREVM